jgi:tetratricopeptide (TPR) repeat protein
MNRYIVLILLMIVVMSHQAMAAETAWEASYRLEAAGQYADAVAVLQTAKTAKSEPELTAIRIAWLHYLQGKYNDAYQHYESALKINPDSMDARLGIVLPLLAQQRWRESEKYLKQVIEASPWNYIAHVRLMIAEEGQKKWDVLAKHAKEVSRRYPTDTTVLVYLARASYWSGDGDDAKEAYIKVLNRLPGHFEATGYLNSLNKK